MITLQDITLYQGHTPLLESTSIAIYPGQKVGVIGRNGTGKSTLFRLLMGEMALDGGQRSASVVTQEWRSMVVKS